ncbi:hypothetical protein GLOIN_2v838603 [Rhizophagus clarus]|nr:hypothetical protein GLOIN_2v838603 [Rhizophagus clarus]
MERGDNMLPPLFIWLFQDYPETVAHCFGRLNPIVLNMKYDKISGNLLDYAADFLLPNRIFPENWMRRMTKQALIYVYTKLIIPRIFSFRLPSIFRNHKLTPEDMV